MWSYIGQCDVYVMIELYMYWPKPSNTLFLRLKIRKSSVVATVEVEAEVGDRTSGLGTDSRKFESTHNMSDASARAEPVGTVHREVGGNLENDDDLVPAHWLKADFHRKNVFLSREDDVRIDVVSLIHKTALRVLAVLEPDL